MKYLFFFLSLTLAAQKTTTNTLKVSAGGIHCTFLTTSPPALTGVHIECISPTSSFIQDTTLAPTPAAGQTGRFLSGPDLLEWRLQLSGPSILYQITSNGKKETGSL